MSNNTDASTQYNDLKGTSAIDFFENFNELELYAIEKGVNTKIYKPIGIKASFTQPGNFLLLFHVVSNLDNKVYGVYVEESFENFFDKINRLEISLVVKGENLQSYQSGGVIYPENENE